MRYVQSLQIERQKNSRRYKKPKSNNRGNIKLKKFFEFSPSRVLNTEGVVITTKEIITPKRKEWNNIEMINNTPSN